MVECEPEEQRPAAPASRGIAAVVLALVLGTSSAAAQKGTASLIPVDSGAVDSAGTERPVDREMCLRGSVYVLAFDRSEGDGEGYATVKYATVGLGAPPDSREVAGITLTPAHQHGWAWASFVVSDYTCFVLSAFNGRARVYELRVGVDW